MKNPLTKNPHDGSTLDEFLHEEGIFEDTEAAARKRALALKVSDLLQTVDSHSQMPPRQFAPGFRISASDSLILLLGCAGAFIAGSHVWWMGLMIGFVTGHFFLFCNVFRISRRPELIWAGTFCLLAICNISTGLPGWMATFGLSLLLATFLIARQMKMPSYHGVGWTRINPGLRAWWEADVESTP